MLRNFGGRGLTGLRGVYERLLKLGYGFSIMASVPLIMDNFQVCMYVSGASKVSYTLKHDSCFSQNLGYGFNIMASKLLSMDNFQVCMYRLLQKPHIR